MRSVVLKEFGDPEQLIVEERARPEPAEGEVLIKVHACGVCGRDLVDRKGGFRFMQLPIVLGHEVAGVIEACGDGVSGFSPGDRVVHTLRAPCGRCPDCLRGNTPQCGNSWKSPGMTADGGYAEYMVMGTSGLVHVPEELDLMAAASLNCTYAHLLRGLRGRGGVRIGERVLVTGASGGGGMAAIRLAKLMGAYVVGVTSSGAHVDRVREAGADDVVVNGDASFHKDLPASIPGGADVVVEAVGTPTFNASLRSLRAGGRLLLYGNITGERLTVNPGKVILSALSIIGTAGSSRRDVQDVLDLAVRGLIAQDIDRVLPLEAAVEAHRALENREAVGRILLSPLA